MTSSEQDDQAIRDLVQLEAQVDFGELDEQAAAKLRAIYELEILESITTTETGLPSGERPASDSGVTRSRTRRIVGTVALIAVMALTVFAVTRSLAPRQPSGVLTGGIPSDIATDTTVPVTVEELEAAVAANPEILPMRLALASRYFEEGSFSAALPHFFAVLDINPTQPEALARLGWMTFLSGEADTAAGFEERALQASPGHAEALWYLANIRLDGLDDPAGAAVLLSELASLPDLGDDERALVESMLEQANEAVAESGS